MNGKVLSGQKGFRVLILRHIDYEIKSFIENKLNYSCMKQAFFMQASASGKMTTDSLAVFI